jgi:hypothetical protein
MRKDSESPWVGGNLGRVGLVPVRSVNRAAVVRRSAGSALSVALLLTAFVSYQATPEPAAVSGPQPTPSTAPGRTPPAARLPGIRLVATPQPDGSFEVAETVVFAAPRAGVLLAAPKASYGGKSFAGTVPRATQVRATADGRPLSVTGTIGSKGYRIPHAVSRLVLRYHLTGVTVRSTPSVAGRALALVVPLTARTDPKLAAWLTIRGTGVRNLTCPLLGARRQQCAPARGEPGVLPKLSARNAVVIVQLDLPTPP